MKMYGDSGSPCLIPLVGWKKGEGCPFIRIEMEVVVMQDIMSVMILVGKLKKCKVSLMNPHSILSKAFSRSSFIKKFAILPFFFLNL